MRHKGHFFGDDDFEYATQIALGASYHRAADVGEVLATIDSVRNGDYDGWLRAWRSTAERVQALGEEAERAGRAVSAREAFLRASAYWFVPAAVVLGTRDGDERALVELWRAHRACFERAAALFDPPFERVEIPYEGTALQGWMFSAERDGGGGPRPLLLLNNGSDGTVTDMYVQGAAPALARGYDCLTFDGPGQNHALYEQGLHFRADWEKVVTPVVDFALGLPGVDPERVAILGVSQAGYWVARAVAFEPRIAAAVLDPGVVDVAETMTRHLPGSMVKLLDGGEAEKFDRDIGLTERFSKSVRTTLAFGRSRTGRARRSSCSRAPASTSSSPT